MSSSNKYGPFTKAELGDKLQNFSEEEMKAYFDERMKKLRPYYILLIGIGILSAVLAFYSYIWWSIGVGFGGLFLLRGLFYKREQFQRLYHNLVYLKKERARTLRETQGIQSKSNKYSKHKENIKKTSLKDGNKKKTE